MERNDNYFEFLDSANAKKIDGTTETSSRPDENLLQLTNTFNDSTREDNVSQKAGISAARIRKTSISMPSKLDEMDDLRIDDRKVRKSKGKGKIITLSIFLKFTIFDRVIIYDTYIRYNIM